MFLSKKKTTNKKIKNILFDAFEVTIFIKAIDGVLEIIGSFLLFFVINPVKISNWIIGLTVHELIQDPNDPFATFMVNVADRMAIDSTSFAAIYLSIHGIVKVLMVVLIWKRKIWAYPLMMIFLASFATYQIYRFTYTHAITLMVLSIFDIITAFLTWNQYNQIRLGQIKTDNDNVK